MEYKIKLQSLILPAIGGLAVWYLSESVSIGVAVFAVLFMPALIALYIPYAKDNPEHLWFKRKLYGWGWTPVTWQGWLTTLVFVGLIVLFSLTVDENSSPSEVAFTFLLPSAFLLITFIRIAYKTGESPKWQWGREKEDGMAEECKRTLTEEGFSHVYEWADPPHTPYEEHAHKGKVSFFVMKGSIDMVVGGEPRALKAGDRIDIPVGVAHTGMVGAEGCTFIVGEEIKGDS